MPDKIRMGVINHEDTRGKQGFSVVTVGLPLRLPVEWVTLLRPLPGTPSDCKGRLRITPNGPTVQRGGGSLDRFFDRQRHKLSREYTCQTSFDDKARFQMVTLSIAP
jgi:hypothetical protein